MRFDGGTDVLRLTTDAPLSYIAHETPFALTQPVTLILGPDEPLEASVERRRARVPRAHARLLDHLGARARHSVSNGKRP